MKMKLECLALFAVFCLPLCAQHVYDMARFGIQPGKKSNMSTRMEKALLRQDKFDNYYQKSTKLDQLIEEYIEETERSK